MRTLLGNDVVDLYKMWHLYNDADPESLKTLWGKGFTTCGLLPDTGDIDRDDIEYKVMNLDYDYIVVSIHHTVNGNYPVIGAALETFRSFYPKNRIILVDGWDRSDLNENIAKECIYFKREMLSKHKNLVQPISFSIPEEKIQDPLEKPSILHHLSPEYLYQIKAFTKKHIYTKMKIRIMTTTERAFLRTPAKRDETTSLQKAGIA